MWTAIFSGSPNVLEHVADPAVRSLLLACLAGVAIGLLRVKTVSVKAAIWRGVLIGALLMPVVVLFVPPVHVMVPLPNMQVSPSAQGTASREPIAVPQTQTANVSLGVNAPLETVRTMLPKDMSTTPMRQSWKINWTAILTGTYTLIAFILLARLIAGVVLGGRLVRGATPIGDTNALHQLGRLTRNAGLRTQPLLGESEMLVVPITLRLWRPAILLPGSWRDWDEGKLSAVLAHEISHVVERDALVQRVALVHRAIFWFSPLAWWLEKHLADLAEQKSDEAALAGGAERARYAETLLGFFAALEHSRSRVWWHGVSMAKCGQAEKRVDRILAWRSAMPNQLKKSLVIAAAVLAVPVIALTASVHPLFFDFPQSTSADSRQVPAAPPAAKPNPSPAINPGQAPESPAISPMAPVGPAVAGAAVAPVGPSAPEAAPLPPPGEGDMGTPAIAVSEDGEEMRRARGALLEAERALRAATKQVVEVRAQLATPATGRQLESVRDAVEAYSKAEAVYRKAMEGYQLAAEQEAERGVSEGIGGGVSGGVSGGISGEVYGDSGPRFVIVTKDSNSVTMSGSSEDEEHAKSLRSRIPGDFIWFERDEKSYIIRDHATVDRAKKLWDPQEELGRKQEALGKQQEALGEQQEALGQKMEQVRVKIPDLSAQMEKLEAEMKQLSANGGTMDQIGDLQSEVGELQSRIGEIQSEAGRQQGEIGRQQGELGRRQGELGRQQGELGRQQGELGRQASRQMKELLDQAIATGTAQPE
jgi:beta-lactamase regulating signal transducer with metallopeptidase domain